MYNNPQCRQWQILDVSNFHIKYPTSLLHGRIKGITRITRIAVHQVLRCQWQIPDAVILEDISGARHLPC